ncbi:MAG TPA: YfjI family protein, partial [Planctomycetaceae bacterium]|nr:YfjI family protein [Planctomycetaceae bacterium]
GCRNPTTCVVAEWAEKIVNRLESYSEVSPSGTGLKIFVCSTDEPFTRITVPMPVEWVSNKEPKMEIFTMNQFMAVTGQPYRFESIEERTEATRLLVAEYLPRVRSTSSSPGSTDKRDFEDNEDADNVTVEKAREYLETVDGAVSRSGGHDVTFAVACKLMIHYALSFRQSMELISVWNTTCEPPWSDADLTHKLKDAGRKQDRRGDLNYVCIIQKFLEAKARNDAQIPIAMLPAVYPNQSLQQDSTAMTTPVLSSFVSSVSTSSSGWPERLPLTTTAQEMSADDFYPALTNMVRAVAEQTETPIELPGLMALGVMATACQGKYRVSLPDGHSEPLNLWVCPAMGPGNRKTSVVTTLAKPLHDWEYARRNKLRPEIEQNNSHRKSMEKQIDSLRATAARKDDDAVKQKILLQIRQLEKELPAVRYAPVLLTDDCTPENVAIMLSRHDEKLSFISDEGGVFDMMSGRYSRGVPNLEVYLQSHAGSSVRVHRSSREDIELRNPCLTIALSVQPEHLRQFWGNSAFSGRGLLDRFLFAIPNSKLGSRKLESRPIPVEISAEWNRLIRNTLDLHQQRNEWGDLVPHALQLDSAAYHLWKQEQAANEIDMRPGNIWGSAPGWASKYPGAVLRIAAIMHIANTVSLGVSPEECTIGHMGMNNAIRLGRKIKQHSLQAFGLMQMDANQQMAVKVSEWIQRNGLSLFTSRDVVRALNGGRSNDGVDEALAILIDSGWIRPTPQPDVRGKGRPSIQFDVNPLVFSNR